MSHGLPGNPHAAYATNHDSPATATLALAFEQRTATLVAVYDQFLAISKAGGFEDEERATAIANEVSGQVTARLGLDTDDA